MNLKPYLTSLRVIVSLSSVFALVLAISWIAGQCRQWSTPPPFKPLPPIVDAGVPIPGPSSQAPTVTEDLPVARPDLTLDELKAEAKKYGMQLTVPGAKAKQTPGAPPTPPEQETAGAWPMFLGSETFMHAPSNAGVDVSAWLPAYGQRVDLRASWREWTPPPAAPGPKQVVCQSGSFFANEAKWYGGAGFGVVANSQGAGLGPTADLGYLGPRTGKVTWGAGSHGAYSQQTGFQGDASFRMSW